MGSGTRISQTCSTDTRPHQIDDGKNDPRGPRHARLQCGRRGRRLFPQAGQRARAAAADGVVLRRLRPLRFDRIRVGLCHATPEAGDHQCALLCVHGPAPHGHRRGHLRGITEPLRAGRDRARRRLARAIDALRLGDREDRRDGAGPAVRDLDSRRLRDDLAAGHAALAGRGMRPRRWHLGSQFVPLPGSIVKRVAVFGNTGGGKSTLARRLAELTRLPLYPLDMIQFRVDAAKVTHEVPHDEYLQAHADLIRRDAWIIDGFGCVASAWERFAAADTLIYVDLPLVTHYRWVTKRLIKGLFRNPEGWPEN